MAYPAQALPKGHLHGLTLSNAVGDPNNDITIAIGQARMTLASGAVQDSEDAVLGAAITKRLDAAWAVGNGNGGLDTGSIANTTYHVFLIESITGAGRVVDALFSASLTPTMPTGYKYYRRIGSIIRSGGAILAFIQDGDDFLLMSPVTDVNESNPGTGTALKTLTVPIGLRILALMTARIESTTTSAVTAVIVADPSISGATAGARVQTQSTAGTYSSDPVPLERYTNTSGQVNRTLSASAAGTVLTIITRGWRDTRGRLA